jgi:hypothetical protein
VLARDGRYVGFSSDADNLLPVAEGDTPVYDTSVRNVFLRQIPLPVAATDTGPDLGDNEHGEHDPGSAEHGGHAEAEHTGHAAEEHAGHTTPTGGPGMTLFGPPVQDIDKLYMLATVHADGKLAVTATVKVAGRKAAQVYRFKGFAATVPAHKEYRVKLKLGKAKLRSVKRALRRGKRLKAKIVGQAQNAAGGPWSKVSRTVRLTK